MHHVRVAVLCNDPANVASTITQSIGIEFESRDSGYWGPYWIARLKGLHQEIQIFVNEDPLYKAGDDPPHEFYFEAKFPNHRTLVDIEGDSTLGEQVVAILSTDYPGTEIVT